MLYNKLAIGAVMAMTGGGALLPGQKPSSTAAPQVIKTSGRPASGNGQMKRVPISDPAFGIVAVTINIPADWKFEGSVLRRNGPCNSQEPNLVYRATSPDGLTAVEILPSYEWNWSNLAPTRAQQCTFMPPMAPADFARKFIIPKVRPGAIVGETSPAPESAQKVAEQVRQYNEAAVAAAQRNNSPLPPIHMSGDVARVHIEYNLNGSAVEEEVSVVTTSKETAYQPPLGSRDWYRTYVCAAYATIFRAPRGQLKSSEKMLRAIVQSSTPDPLWLQKQNGLAQQQAQQNNADIVSRGQAANANTRAIGEASRKRAANAEDARHKGAEATADYVSDRQKVRDPNTGRVSKVSSKYTYTWVNQNGLKYQTNSSTDDPNGRLEGTWTLMQGVR
jgi:hypothetical protein